MKLREEREVDFLVDQAVKAERERIAAMVDDFSWTLPMYSSAHDNELSDDTAETVKAQIAAVIRAQT